MKWAALLLAAGASSRFGSPKALVPWRGTTLLQHLERSALDAGACRAFRILGSQAETLRATAPACPATQDVLNPDWQAGMGSSIACGLRTALQVAPSLDAVLVLPCDLPLVDADILRALAQLHAGAPDRIALCDFGNGRAGPPALFGRDHFPALLKLEGDAGARSVKPARPEDRLLLHFPGGLFDIDTPEALARLQASQPSVDTLSGPHS